MLPLSEMPWLAHFEIEDVILFFWLTVFTPFLDFALGNSLRDLDIGAINSHIPNAIALGMIFILSAILAIACSVTRAPLPGGDQEFYEGTGFGYAHLPMIASTGIIVFLGLDLLGLEDLGIGMLCGILGLFGVGLTFYKHMPMLDFAIRRMLMTPFILLSTTLFSASVQPLVGRFAASDFSRLVQSELGRFELGLILAAAVVYYLMFVFAPRMIAGSRGGWLPWSLRFVMYIVGFILNLRLMQIF